MEQEVPSVCSWYRGTIPQTAFMSHSGLAVGVNQGLPHQDSTNEFSLFFGRISHVSLVAHGFVTG